MAPTVERKEMIRVLRVPIAEIAKEDRTILEEAATNAADFCNQSLAQWWMERKFNMKAPVSAEVDCKELSSYAKGGAHGQLQGIKKRLGKRILHGDIQLPTFTRDRSLMLRADREHVGARVSLEQISIQPRPKPAPWIQLPIWTPALGRDWFLRETLQHIAAGQYELRAVGIRFRGRKIFAHLTYYKPAAAENGSALGAEVRYNESGELWLAMNGRRLNLTETLYRLSEKRKHFAAIQNRLSRCLGRANKRRNLRRALLRRQTYAQWSEGPIGQLAAHVAKWALAQGAGSVISLLPRDGSLPWTRIRLGIQSRCQEAGLNYQEIEPSEDLLRDWGRLAEMGKSYRKLLDQLPPYDLVA